MAKPCHSIQSLHIDHLINSTAYISPLALPQQKLCGTSQYGMNQFPMTTKEPLRGFNNALFCFVPYVLTIEKGSQMISTKISDLMAKED